MGKTATARQTTSYDLQLLNRRGIKSVQRLERLAGSVEWSVNKFPTGNHRDPPIRPVEFQVRQANVEIEADIGEIGEVPEVVKSSGEVVVKQGIGGFEAELRYPLRANRDEEVIEEKRGWVFPIDDQIF